MNSLDYDDLLEILHAHGIYSPTLTERLFDWGNHQRDKGYDEGYEIGLNTPRKVENF